MVAGRGRPGRPPPAQADGPRRADATLPAAHAEQPFRDLDDVARRAGLNARLLEQLATAGAFASLGTGRREAIWRAGAHVTHRQPVLPGLGTLPDAPELPAMTARETTLADLAETGATTGPHPVHHLRDHLTHLGAQPAAAIRTRPGQTRIRLGGIINYLQRPPTAPPARANHRSTADRPPRHTKTRPTRRHPPRVPTCRMTSTDEVFGKDTAGEGPAPQVRGRFRWNQ
ncbi:hypothetical protein [Streptomyces sp. CA-111067]|uniref:helix-hairpin-helix domain-containing protein n=1 Tax=Streptomyces sp. CA-111067 TaxID=3240046 RepID=UPI003D956352